MARAPAPPSSAGWKQVHRAVEAAVLLQVAGRGQQHGGVAVMAAAVHLAVMARTVFELVSSCIGRASMSARSMMARSDVPWRSTPTTPVLAMPVWTSMPQPRSASAYLGGAVLFVAQLRMGVQIAPQRHDVFQVR